MTFTHEELSVMFQAMCVAEYYYTDPHAQVRGMTPADPAHRTKRLQALRPIMERIMHASKDMA